MSPPMPVMCGSVTFNTAAIAIAASDALPPRRSTSMPTSDASGWLLATIAWLARTTDRPVATLENQSLVFEGCAAVAAALKRSTMAGMRQPFRLASRNVRRRVRTALQLARAHGAELDEAVEAARFAGGRPLKADRSGLLPSGFGRIGGVVSHVTHLRPIQPDVQPRPLEPDAQVVPVALLSEVRELLIAGIEPQHVAAERLRAHAVHDDADERSRLAPADVHLIPGAKVDAAVVEAGLVLAGVHLAEPDDLRRTSGAVLGQHEVQLELDILERGW